ncbi:TRAP transporter small permease subunit [Parahaliea sp. F7430]|uniref:TRAP transporter small permease protein n=1 Tax=Sediminihaliea albiluteola TaxID=2758564 RepID=A0A7W2TXA1_9GAMM|nr:TRAP transporter small permease subunit [Sediminihaliea albiluteola]MBA6413625.1 TRAP transporter small permease subunit [Sediminihaliea albiluteola]
MTRLQATVHAIDQFTEFCGRALAWLSIGMALLTTLVVILRYGFNIGSIASQEAITYMHGTLFMLGSAYTLRHGGHVRVDIFYRRFSAQSQAWINSLGGIIFLLPLCAFLFAISWNYVVESWSIRESSAETGGIPAIFLLKSLLPLMAACLFLQGLAETLRSAEQLIKGRSE